MAAWNWKRWGLIGLGLTTVVELGLAFSGAVMIPVALAFVVVYGLVVFLIWPRRAYFSKELDVAPDGGAQT